MSGPHIIFEDREILVVYKPAGVAVQTAKLGQADLVSELKNYLAGTEQSKVPAFSGKKIRTAGGEPYLGVIHRLDQPVEGLLVFAKVKEAAAKLSRQIEGHQAGKYYYALTAGVPEHQEGELRDYLLHDPRSNSTIVLDSFAVKTLKKDQAAYCKEASLVYKMIRQQEGAALMEIKLETGRHHQIRAQMAHHGMPLVGDTKYFTPSALDLLNRPGSRQIALCAYKLEFFHPGSGQRQTYEIEPMNPIFTMFFAK